MARLQLVTSAEDLDEFCDRHGYTVDQLADELNVSRATVFNWKRDKRGLPRVVSLALAAIELDESVRSIAEAPEKRRKQYRRGTYASVEGDK